MRVLVGKSFGIGNLVMAVPMLKAIRSLKPEKLDLLVGTSDDDAGATLIAAALKHRQVVDEVHYNTLANKNGLSYTHAVMAIPFDGRWHNHAHFSAETVLDGRPRPDPTTFGFSSWEKHEVLYQMENAEKLGYSGSVPSCEFMQLNPFPGIDGSGTVYLGLGYKKDRDGFWKFKHWGNENYAKLVRELVFRGLSVVTTGDVLDLQLTIRPIMDMLSDIPEKKFRYIPVQLADSFQVVSSCFAYVGNDTGMMHVAASFGKKVHGIFMDEKLITKNCPWVKSSLSYHGWKDLKVSDIVDQIQWGV